jgi:hypothetical protein
MLKTVRVDGMRNRTLNRGAASLYAPLPVLILACFSAFGCDKKTAHASPTDTLSPEMKAEKTADKNHSSGGPSKTEASFTPAPEPPILRIEPGMHTAAITGISVNGDGGLVLTSSKDQTARLWELPSGRLLRTFRPYIGNYSKAYLSTCSLSPDGLLAAVSGWNGVTRGGSVYVFNTADGSIIQSFDTEGIIQDIAFSTGGRYLALLDARIGLRIWGTHNWKEAAKDDTYGTSRGLTVDWYGDERIVTTSQDGPMRLYTMEGESLKCIAKASGADLGTAFGICDARFSPSGQEIAILVRGDKHIDPAQLAVMDARNLAVRGHQSLNKDRNNMIGTCLAWIGDKPDIALEEGKFARYSSTLDETGWKTRSDPDTKPYSDVHSLGPGEKNIAGMKRLPNGNLLISLTNSSWGVLTDDGKISILGSPAIIDYKDSDCGQLQLSEGGSRVTLLSEEFERLNFEVKRRELSLTRGSSGRYEDDPPLYELPTLRNRYDESGNRYLDSAKGRSAGSRLIGLERGLRLIEDYTERWRIPLRSPALAVGLSDDNSVAMAALGDGTIRWYRADTGVEILALFVHADRKHWVLWATEYGPGRARIGIQTEPEQPNVIKAVELENAVKAGLKVGDQVIRVDKTPIINDDSLYEATSVHKARDHVKITIRREGKEMELDCELTESVSERPVKRIYYDASAGAEDLIGWHVNRGPSEAADFFPASRFRSEFYRPDIIDRVLVTHDVAEAVKQANEAAGGKSVPLTDVGAAVMQRQPPSIELLTGGPAKKVEVNNVSDVTLRYRVKKGLGGEEVKRVKVMLDGRPSLLEAPIPKNDGEMAAVDVPIPSKECTVSILAENRYAASEAAVLRVIPVIPQLPEQQGRSTKQKRRLVVLSVGVNAHLNNSKEMDRPWNKNDAEDLVGVLKKQAPRLYRDVQSRVLTGPDATARNILDGFDWLRRECKADDTVVILLMGHGGNDEKNRFVFISYDFDDTRRDQTSVSYEEIQRCLSNLPGRVILFVGSCHSGDVLGGRGSERLPVMDTTQLSNALASEENGVVVFTASTGRQVAWSGSKLRNSLFFQAILEGLNGKADLLRKGTITVASLETYISSRVPELFEKYIAKGEAAKKIGAITQTPTVAKPQTIPDFVIATD